MNIFPTHAYEKLNPTAMRRVGTLFGLSTPPISESKILEVGCGFGTNLVSLGLLYPDGEFVGIDEEGNAIAGASDLAKELGVKNVEFIEVSAEEYEGATAYDYVMVPFLSSCLEGSRRDAMFGFLASMLTDDGLGVVGYATYPGAAVAKTVRDMMLFHTRQTEGFENKIRESRNILSFVANSNENNSSGYKTAIGDEVKLMNSLDDQLFYQEYLTPINDPCFFSDVVSMGGKHGLKYVGDVDFEMMFILNYEKSVQTWLGDVTDSVQREQYFDFILNRRVRNTVFTKSIGVSRDVPLERFSEFKYRLKRFPKAPIDDLTYERNSLELVTPGIEKADAKVTGRAVIACIDFMARSYPRALEMAEIIEGAAQLAGLSVEDAKNECDSLSGKAVISGIFMAEGEEELFVRELSENPKVFALAGHQATRGLKVNNTLQQTVQIKAIDQKLMPIVNGESGWEAPIEAVRGMIANGMFSVTVEDTNAVGEDLDPKLVAKAFVEDRLRFYAVNALLVG